MTSLLDRLSDAMGRALDGMLTRADSSPGYALNVPEYQIGKPRWLDGNIQTYRQAFATTTAVYRCVGARAQAVSSAPVRVYQEHDGDRTEIPDHPLRLVMQRPNPMMSEAEWMVMTQTLMDATGFAAIEKVRNAAGGVVQLWHLRADWLKEIKRSQRPSDWEYRVPNRNPITINADDIIIVPGGPSTDLRTVGMSPIAVALREVGIDAGLTDFLKLFIEGGGTPLHALVFPDRIEDEEEAKQLRDKFGYLYGGFRNWTKTVILHGGLDYKKIGSNMDELAYPQLRSLTETHICSVFGVPPIIAGVQAGIDASTYSNYEQARKAFFEDTVVALWARLDGALTRGLLYEFTDDPRISLEFDTSSIPALREDQNQLWARVQGLLGTAGLTLNQAQAMLGLPGFGEAGDVLYLPISLQPTRPDDLAALADMTIEAPQPVPAALTGGDDGAGTVGGSGSDTGETDAERAGRADSASRNGDRTTGAARGPTDAGAGEPVRGTMASDGTRIRTIPLDFRARIATNNRRHVSRLTAKFAPRLRKMFAAQGETIAAAYTKRGKEAPNLRALDAIDWDDIESEMEAQLRALYQAAGKLAFDAAADQLGVGISWDISNLLVRQTVAQLARRVVGVNETTRQDVARVVANGIEEGLTTPQIAENLQGLFAETYRGRSMAIARTESQVSYNLATAAGYKESGVVMAMTLHDNVNHTDDYGALDALSCAQRDGVITDVDTVDVHIYSEHVNGSLAVSPLLVRPLGAA